MKLFTVKLLIENAKQEWMIKYRYIKLTPFLKEIKEELERLPDNPTLEQVNHAMKNSHWTSIWCDECHQNVEIAVRLGQEPDYESQTATICVDCLRKAVALAERSDKQL